MEEADNGCEWDVASDTCEQTTDQLSSDEDTDGECYLDTYIMEWRCNYLVEKKQFTGNSCQLCTANLSEPLY